MATNWKGSSCNYQKYLLDVMALYKVRPDLKVYLELILSVVTIAFLTLFAIKPTLVTIAQLVTKINSEQETSNLMDVKIKNLGLAQALLSTNKEKISLLSSAVPDAPEVQTYLRQIEGVIKKYNLVETSLAVKNTPLIVKPVAATDAGDKEVNISVTIGGEYTNLVNFLGDVENLRRPNIIKEFTMSQNDKTLNLILVLEVPYQS